MVRSVAVVAQMSLSPRLFSLILIIKIYIYMIKVSKKIIDLVLKKNFTDGGANMGAIDSGFHWAKISVQSLWKLFSFFI